MPDTKISALSTLSSPGTGTYLPAADGGANGKLGRSEVAAWLDAAPATTNTQTASYTLVLADAGKVIEMDVATANNLTVPPNSSVAFPVGTEIVVYQVNTGATTLVQGSGVTIRNPGSSLVLRTRWSSATLRKRATDEWVVTGDLQ